jgi:hypothetical protein
MNHKYVSFDLETAKVQPPAEQNWKADRPLGISCAATFCCDANVLLLWYGMTKSNRPARRMSKEEACGLADYLAVQVLKGYTILTWNGIGFDFDILAEESGMLEECRRLAVDHIDMMFHVLCQLGFGVSLASAAGAMGIEAKENGVNGTNAPRLWAERRRRKVLEYVARDARITLQLATICEKINCFRWVTLAGRQREMPLRRGWLTVRNARRLPKPCNAWMYRYWSRRKWTSWLIDYK